MQVIFGFDSIETGQILLNGKEMKINSPAEAIESGIAISKKIEKNIEFCLV